MGVPMDPYGVVSNQKTWGFYPPNHTILIGFFNIIIAFSITIKGFFIIFTIRFGGKIPLFFGSTPIYIQTVRIVQDTAAKGVRNFTQHHGAETAETTSSSSPFGSKGDC